MYMSQGQLGQGYKNEKKKNSSEVRETVFPL